MSKLSDVAISGKSGKKYSFEVYQIDASFKSYIPAVYIATRRYKKSNGDINHEIIYVGQTGDLKERHTNHHKADCFTKENANCLCIIQVKNESERLEIERDIIDKYNPPCNSR